MFEFLIAVVAFSGLIIGFIINKFVEEELDHGKKYFIALRKIMILAIISVFLYYSYDRYIALLLGIISGYFLRKEYFYLGMGLVGGFSIAKELIAGIVFIYGISYSAVNYKKLNYRRISSDFLYFAVPFLMYLIPFDFSTDAIAFAAGALFWRLR